MGLAIGRVSFRLETASERFRELLVARYSGFVAAVKNPDISLQITLRTPTEEVSPDDDLLVTSRGRVWNFKRGDFFAEWNCTTGFGTVTQHDSPYAIDSVIRVALSLFLASRSGLLVHGASAIRDGRAYMFAGVSGAGKTTISRLAPPSSTLLSDEVSLIRLTDRGYFCFGTPFSGELATPGENTQAPLDTVYFLEQSANNEVAAIGDLDANRCLLRNVLFFSQDTSLVNAIFDTVCDLTRKVPTKRLKFAPTPEVWEIIGSNTEVCA